MTRRHNPPSGEQWPRLLARCLPRAISHEVFQPAWQDARYDMLVSRRLDVSGGFKSAAAVRYAVVLLLLFLDCWRLSLAAALRSLAGRGFANSPPGQNAPLHSHPHHRTHKPEMTAVLKYYLKHAVRRLLREPGFTIAAVLTLAIGIGANTSVFAVVEAVLLRPLPYLQAENLVIVRHRDTRTLLTKDFIPMADYVDMQRDQRSFQSFSTFGPATYNLVVNGDPTPVKGLQAGPNLLQALGIRPLLGRLLSPEDSRAETACVIMLGAELWRSTYSGDSSVVGRSVRIGKSDCTVVGVAPSGFRFPPTASADIIVPMGVPLVAPTARRNEWTFTVARLKPGVTLPSALRELTDLSARMARDFPNTNQASSYYALPLRDALVGDAKKALTLLLGAVCVLLLIACANVANLLLARSLGRRREMAVKLALGAGRRRLALQLLSESLVLATVASVVGIGIAFWGAAALVKIIPNSENIPGMTNVHINASVLVFAVAVTVATSLVFALVSMLTSTGKESTSVLVSAGRASMSQAARRATSGLVGVEIALAIMLLIGAGLITRSFTALLAVDPGFKYDRVATMDIRLPSGRYPDPLARSAAFQRIFNGLRANPLVLEVGAAAVTPLTGNNWTASFIRSDVAPVPGEQPPEVGWQQSSGAYFKAMQIPLLAGRVFDDRDIPGGRPVVMISEAIQKKYFPNESAVGKFIRQDTTLAEIIGVVGNIRRAGLTDEPRGDLYISFERTVPNSTTIFVRTRSEAGLALLPLTDALKKLEPGIAVNGARTLADVAGESVRVTKLMLWLLTIFAVTALVLAAVGIYGVMSYVVRQRSKEIGTRIALGATSGNILRLVMKEGMIIAVGGTAVGLAAGVFATRLLNSVLYNVSPSDPLTMSMAASVILLTTLIACYVPARRASSIQPARTLSEQ